MLVVNTVVIDNYDSFTYNLVHYIEEINGCRPMVFRNDQVSLELLDEFEVIILSPGPGLPEESNLLMQICERYSTTKIILGVCLGHQALTLHFGGKLQNLNTVYHGVSSNIKIIENDEIHQRYDKLEVGRYHSWVADPNTFPTTLKVTSVDEDGNIMSFRHQELPIFGIQYHPESVLTPKGKELLQNFYNFCRMRHKSFLI